ncbi:MAG: LuxR family transcriptional regulator [Alphaproteobacteria bacterium]|nr:LuxR family transcriptional regulator [Alphaproteobacteria bacterium]
MFDQSKRKLFYKQLKIHKLALSINNSDKKVLLSPSETKILLLLIKSKTYEQISQELNISFKTVETYIIRIKEKTNLNYKNDILDAIPNNIFELILGIMTSSD